MTTAQAILEAAHIIRDGMRDNARLHAEWLAHYQHQHDATLALRATTTRKEKEA